MFTVGAREPWSVIAGNYASPAMDIKEASVSCDVEALEEEYHQAIAANIVQELYQQKRKMSATQKTPKPPSRESQKLSNSSGAKKLSKPPSASSLSNPKFSEIPQETFKEVPERVVQLVQKLLDAPPQEQQKSQDSVTLATKVPDTAKMVLDIWDFAAKEEYYTIQQMFLSPRALYVFVFKLNQDLEENVSDKKYAYSESLSTLEYLDFWLKSILAHTSSVSSSSTFSPPVFIVGTHRDCLGEDDESIKKAVEEKLGQVQDFLVGKPYIQHLVTPFYAVNNLTDDSLIAEFRIKLEEASCREPYIGEQIPIRWIRFEQEVSILKNNGANYATYDQMSEITGHLGIVESTEVSTMLKFYHDLGVLIYYGSGKSAVDNLLRNTVILNPKWLLEMISHVLSVQWKPQDKWNLIRDKWTRLQEFGILEEPLLDTLWHEAREQKPLLLGLLEKFDLACQRLPSVAESQGLIHGHNRSFYVPARLTKCSESNSLYCMGENDITFYVNFHGFLPGGLFQRIITRTTKWSQDIGGQNPYFMYKNIARFFLDVEHDFLLEMASSKLHRIKVVILRVSESESDSERRQLSNAMSPPSPHACAKVRNFLESCLSDIREMWMRRISYSVVARCPCECVCETHKKEGCLDESCLHFLNLDECLANKIVMCDHRRVKTSGIRKFFPEPLTLGFYGPVLPSMSLRDLCGNIEKNCPNLPSWVKSAAKLLNNGESGRDWNSLARELGYKQNQINLFNDDLNPGLALLADWIVAGGNTGLAVDALTVYLEKLDREDVVEIIQKAKDQEQGPAKVFLSYQWDSQDEVKGLRSQLEKSGFTCWMDIGQIGGGDHLYAKIDEAIRNCKAVICCVTPKFTTSQLCMKELSLADLLRKPIIPVMIEHTIWPPPGGMALILSQLVYINMKGVGGHGGTGIHADRQDKYREIIQRLSLHTTPDTCHLEPETDTESKKSHLIEHEMLSNFTEYTDRNSMGGSLISMPLSDMHRLPVPNFQAQQPIVLRQVDSGAAPNARTVEQVNVSQCKICSIL
ncbi:uncharacterized protein LOC127863023 isoform X2 [Dreissena polymorpha]|nr:uncharacterized protein LOC127863023 isoform X2 [Dreissena polymorpha]XP_052258333.1 uncharacterized protein LOC127863023 isoform X2 [Dreissena polymorpha]XP_052258334.1 uncharacterized protein LOC127863023 isoform X2 [Dreissena polymorpha]XP_052258335.1 uncharacterized protein LOC127863023 isoform X2 [Dreissena polymorpha]